MEIKKIMSIKSQMNNFYLKKIMSKQGIRIKDVNS